MQDLMGWPIAQVSFGAMLLGAVWLILTGKIVPRRTLDDAEARARKWEEAYLVAHDALAEVLHTLKDVKEVGETTVDLLRSITNQRTPS